MFVVDELPRVVHRVGLFRREVVLEVGVELVAVDVRFLEPVATRLLRLALALAQHLAAGRSLSLSQLRGVYSEYSIQCTNTASHVLSPEMTKPRFERDSIAIRFLILTQYVKWYSIFGVMVMLLHCWARQCLGYDHAKTPVKPVHTSS